MRSVKYNGTELVNSTYLLGRIAHESAPEVEVKRMVRTNDDGSAYISKRFGEKKVTLSGTITADDTETLEERIDAFKAAFHAEQGTLTVEWGGKTRSYTATCERHEFDRRHFDILACPWSATFLVPEGVGTGEAETVTWNDISPYTAPVKKTFTAVGSAPPKPKFTLTVMSDPSWSSAKGLMVRNSDTYEAIMVPIEATWGIGDTVEIDCDNETVNSTVGDSSNPEVVFLGSFPKFMAGENSVDIQFGSLPVVGTAVNDPTECTIGLNLISATTMVAQCFEVPRDVKVEQVRICAEKVGNISLQLHQIRLETDDGGLPSGSLVDGLDAFSDGFTTAVSDSGAWKTARLTEGVGLEANTRYWLVVKVLAGTPDASNYLRLLVPPTVANPYPKGFAAFSSNSGSTWFEYDGRYSGGGLYRDNWDLAFEIDAGGTSASSANGRVVMTYSPRFL
jgi:hypothetical protein